MEDEAYVRVLRESLEKKVELLQLISKENEVQSKVLKDPTSTPDELQATMDHKDVWVDQISTHGGPAAFGIAGFSSIS